MQIRIARSDAELELISGVMLELRTEFTREDLIAQMREQQRGGYRIAYVESAGEILCVAGYVMATKLAWGKHIYIDDLVTAERHRSTGAGARMIEWFKSHAREHGCQQLHLDSGVQRFGAHRFYLRHGFDILGHHFAIADLSKAV